MQGWPDLSICHGERVPGVPVLPSGLTYLTVNSPGENTQQLPACLGKEFALHLLTDLQSLGRLLEMRNRVCPHVHMYEPVHVLEGAVPTHTLSKRCCIRMYFLRVLI